MALTHTRGSRSVIVDATGVAFELAHRHARRIVSLVPSLTEALFALGLGEHIAGVTRFCEEPAGEVAALPKVGGTKDPGLDRVVELKPELVIASSEENREEDVVALRRSGVEVFVTHYPTVRSAVDGIAALARYLGVDAERYSWWTDARDTATRLAGSGAIPVRYFCPIWRRPYMVARRDTYMSDLLALAGGCSVFASSSDAHYFAVELADLCGTEAEVILLPDEPFRFQQRHIADFARCAAVPAVRDRRIHLVDGKALTWYGPRTAAALRYFAAILGGDATPQGADEATLERS